MKADPAGLGQLAEQLSAAAVSLSSTIPAALVHPPLATDVVSTAAAGRLSAGAAVLVGNVTAHGADLAQLAARLAAVASGFAAQEAANAVAAATLTTAPSISAHAVPAGPLVRPPVAPDVRPPVPPAALVEGEVLAAMFDAGSASLGSEFGAGCQSAAAVLRDAARDLRAAAAALPQVWRTSTDGPALVQVFSSRADTFEHLADQADHLNRQRGDFATSFADAQQEAPKPQDYENNRQRYNTAVQNNIRSGGLMQAEVAAAVAERGRLEAKANETNTAYLAQANMATNPHPGPGADGKGGGTPGAGQVPPEGAGLAPGDTNSAATEFGGLEGLDGAGLDDPAIAEMLPAVLQAITGAAGGLLGAAFSGVQSVPQQVMQAGGQALQGITSAVGGKGMKPPELSGLDPKLGPPDLSELGNTPTTPSGGGGGLDAGMPGVTGAGPLSSPAAPVGATSGAAAGSSGGAGAGPSGGMPMGGAPMGGQGGAGGKEDRKREQQRVALRELPNSEQVTGQPEQRVAVAAAGTEESASPPASEKPRKNEIRIIHDED